jgi:Tol biopolymer transport system component
MKRTHKALLVIPILIFALAGCSWMDDSSNPNDLLDPNVGLEAKCPDSVCDVSEDPSTCPEDCHCGDGACDADKGEDALSCPDDCAKNKNTGPFCGDGTCDADETTSNCQRDCTPEAVCGNGTCESGETTSSCPDDCKAKSQAVAGPMTVSPDAPLSIAGVAGGSFSPASKDYVVTNMGTAEMKFSVAISQSWLDVSPKDATLAAGEHVTVKVSVTDAAKALAVGDYNDTIVFKNETNDSGSASRTVAMSVTSGSFQRPDISFKPISDEVIGRITKNIVFVSTRNSFSNLYASSFVDILNPTLLTANAIYDVTRPSFSPDGKKVAFSQTGMNGRFVAIADVAAGTTTQLTRFKNTSGGVEVSMNPSWDTTDGSLFFLAFKGTTWEQEPNIIVHADADGSNAHEIQLVSSALGSTAKGGIDKVVRVGDYVLFSMKRTDTSPKDTYFTLYFRSLNDWNPFIKKLIIGMTDDGYHDDIQPAISVDGKFLYWTRDYSNSWHRKEIMFCKLDLENGKCTDAKPFAVGGNGYTGVDWDYVNASPCGDGSVLFTSNMISANNREIMRKGTDGVIVRLTNNNFDDFDAACNPALK